MNNLKYQINNTHLFVLEPDWMLGRYSDDNIFPADGLSFNTVVEGSGGSGLRRLWAAAAKLVSYFLGFF